MSEFKRIKDWAEDEKPREKLSVQGKAALSNSELLAILISSGNTKKTAMDLAREILINANNDFNTLARWEIKDFCRIDGIGMAKAVTIIAALELSARRMWAGPGDRPMINNSQEAYMQMKFRLEDLNHEEFWVLTLSRHNRVMHAYKVSEGGLTSTVVDARKVFTTALQDKCTGIVLFHNHPSGVKRPSNSDIDLTKKVRDGGKLLDISVVDHIIIGQDGYFSFADAGML